MRIALVTPCTKNKSSSAMLTMSFCSLAADECTIVAHQWIQAAHQREDLIHARSLYKGTGWNHSLSAQELIGSTCELWIASAGFGLVTDAELLPTYEATFAAQENRVAEQMIGFKSVSSAHAAWWKTINAMRGRTQSPLQETFAKYDRVIVALSAPYLMALREDLALLAQSLGPDRLWLVAIGAQNQRLSPELRGCVVPLTSDIERLVSSPRLTLNLRALVWWLETIIPLTGWNREAQNQEISRRLSSLRPKIARAKRTLTDEEVVDWIQKQKRDADGKWSHGGKTGLLRTLRVSGLACSQKRFSHLYSEVITRP